MKKSVAKELVFETLELGERINRIILVVDKVDDLEAKARLREIVGYLMGYAADIIFNVEKVYPDLNPDARPQDTQEQ